jgi:hypothetical protein
MPNRIWLVLLTAAIVIGPVWIVAQGEPTAADTNRTLNVAIPYDAPRAGTGQLTIDVLDPEDAVLAHVQRTATVAAGQGSWQESLRILKAPPVDELVWDRLRYRFAYADRADATVEGTESISQILRRPVLHIVAQQAYQAGAQAAVRLVVTDANNTAVSSGWVRVELADPAASRELYTGSINGRGTAEAQFRLPAGLTGTYSIHYVAETPIGTTEYTQQVRIQDKASILLTTEKPIYQPGQTIHVRALALDRGTHEAAASRDLTFEMEDSRGNKVFRKATQTDKFGVASAEFTLADEVNLGTYHLRALMGTTAEIAVNVERYVLPKFKVAVEFAGQDGKARHGYRPGDHVTGTVRANYFFGKPVAGEVTVKGTGMDVALFSTGEVHGKTDRDGEYRFDLELPEYLAGRPLSGGAARVLIEATVKDTAAHAETRGEPITVSASPLILTAIPEGGTLIPNLENQIFVLASYADGKPAEAQLRIRAAGNPEQSISTDDGGVAMIRVKAGADLRSLDIEASDKEGNRARTNTPLLLRGGDEQILLRMERAVFRAGDHIALRVFSTRERGSAYVDIVKEGQTILTRDLDLVNGQAVLSLTATPELVGTLDINAYLFGRNAQPVADHRLVFVQPADELKIEATADAPAHRPGAEARVRFRVTNQRGEGVQAALGLQVVDEAVFALAEKQPGFAKVFFYLEQDAMKPRYEIHSIAMPDVVEPVEVGRAGQRDRAARALFAATEMVNSNRFQTEVGRRLPLAKQAEYQRRYQARFQMLAEDLAAQLTRTYAKNPGAGDLVKLLDAKRARDAWGTAVRVERPSGNQDRVCLLRSAGADKQLGTGDDLFASLEVHTRKTAAPAKIDISIEHDHGPFNGSAEIVGIAAEGTPVTARASNGQTRVAIAGANGQFQLSALPAGDYEIQVEYGANAVHKNLTLKARDRAVLSVTMKPDVIEAVTVSAVPPQRAIPVRLRGLAGNGVVGGVPGGLPAGVLGGIIQAGQQMGGGSARQAVAWAMPAAAPSSPVLMAEKAAALKDMKEPAGAAPHVRSYFPEALYINPEIITDGAGQATITIPLADSITTWRMTMLASTAKGALGSGTSSLKVFQDFFVDLDLPVTLTQGDRVSIPVAAHNYAGAGGDVSLQLKVEDWYSLVEDTADKTIAVDSGRVGGTQFTIEARRIGKFKLTLAARMAGGGGRADIVVREIEVVPNGREQNLVFNGRLDSAAQHRVEFPRGAIPEASKVLVRLYPGPLSQVIEGMDAILRMPFGCFEQTSSATYPNVLALDYMKRTKKLTPEVHAKAEGFIGNGYQRLLTFEVPGGGFSWFGQAPANKILTTYGLMEFSDMSKVHDVDPKVIQRTQQWLAGLQQPDGSWQPDTQFINEGATNRFNTDALRIAAYIAWGLENTGYQGPAVERTHGFVAEHMGAKADAYTLAVVANFAVDYGKDREFANRAMHALLDAKTEQDDQVWWTTEETNVFARGPSAGIETTGLAVQALLKWGQASPTIEKALKYIASHKDASGTWGTTQATIMALRALLLSTEKGSADVRGTVEIALNGKTIERLTLTPENNDLLHQFVLQGVDQQSANNVSLKFEGKGGLAYQVVGRYFAAWTEKPADEPLSISVAYDRTRLAQDDIATATATVKNNLDKTAKMVMVDLGIPPGFDLLSEDLQDYLEKSATRKSGRLEKFNLTATQAILYFDSFAPGDTVNLKFRLRAKYPIRTRTFQSRVYEYYDPEVKGIARPIALEVRK